MVAQWNSLYSWDKASSRPAPELMIDEEFPDNGNLNAAGPSSHVPLDVAGPSHFNPYEAAGTFSANNRDPRFKQDTQQQQRPFQTWSTKSSNVRNRGAISNGTNYSHGKRMEPYKAQPRAQPQPQPLPIGYFSDAKNAKRTEYEKRLLELLKQSQAKLRRFKRHWQLSDKIPVTDSMCPQYQDFAASFFNSMFNIQNKRFWMVTILYTQQESYHQFCFTLYLSTLIFRHLF